MLGPFATASRRTPPVLDCHSSGVATVARRLRINVHNNDNDDNAWQRGPLWPHGMGPMNWCRPVATELLLRSQLCRSVRQFLVLKIAAKFNPGHARKRKKFRPMLLDPTGPVDWPRTVSTSGFIRYLPRDDRKERIENKKHSKNVGPIRHCEPPHAACSNFTFTRCRYCRHHYQDEPKPAIAIAHATCDSSDTRWMAM